MCKTIYIPFIHFYTVISDLTFFYHLNSIILLVFQLLKVPTTTIMTVKVCIQCHINYISTFVTHWGSLGMSITSFISILVIGHPTLGGETYVFAPVSLFICSFVSQARGGQKCPTECPTNRGEGKEREYRLQTQNLFEYKLKTQNFFEEKYLFFKFSFFSFLLFFYFHLFFLNKNEEKKFLKKKEKFYFYFFLFRINY